jgi:Ca2+-binding EF-hand superfamily protein
MTPTLLFLTTLLAADPQAPAGLRTTGGESVDLQTTVTATGETRDSLLLLPAGPLHLRIHVSLGGRSLAASRVEYAKSLIKSLDTNGDGKLTRDEAAKSPLLRTKTRESAKGFLQSIGAGEKTIDQRDIEKTIERYGGETVVYRQDEAASEPDQQVFAFLDIDKNGVIDTNEISGAADRLLDKDSDRDQCVTFDEFAPPVVVDPIAALNQTPKPAATVAEMLRDARDPFLGRRLVQIYDRDRSKSLSMTEIGFSEDRFKLLDANGDGALKDVELAGLAGLPVDLELSVNLAPGEGEQPGVKILAGADHRIDAADRPDFVKVKFRDAVIGVSHRHIDPIARTMESGMRVFNRLDVDANGYLDTDEVKDSVRFERGLFELMDVDGDGKVFGEEMKQYVAGRGEPAASTCKVNLYDTGFGFFPTLDRNGDGRISERERRAMHKALGELDRDGQPGITPKEPIRHFHIELVRGTYMLFGAPDQSNSPLPAFQSRPPVGPAWFQAMDRNNDGDLSWEEFQASRQDFDHIDGDEDDLIDPNEAQRADDEYSGKSGEIADVNEIRDPKSEIRNKLE